MFRQNLLSLALVGLMLAGCSDSPEGDPPATFGSEVDQCVGSTDMAIIEARRETVGDGGVAMSPDGGAAQEVIRYFEDCARADCFGDVFADDVTDLIACSNACIDATDVSALSTGCRECYIEEVKCAIDECLIPCSGTDSAGCDTCVTENCDARLTECIGF